MALKGPTHEDLRKLHAEINQIGNQRFMLTTLALTMSGAVIAWMIPKSAPQVGADAGPFLFAVTAIFSVLLFGIYIWGHLLKNTMRTLTCYLVETGTSGWELDWREFRRDPHYAHTKPQTVIFLLLNPVGCFFPFLLSLAYSLKIAPVMGAVITVAIFSVTEFLIWRMGFRNLWDAESKITKRWKGVSAN